MKRYKEFVNEGLRAKMTPKSDEDITKSLSKLNDYQLGNYIITSIEKNDKVLLDLILKHGNVDILNDNHKYRVIEVAIDYANIPVITHFLELGLSNKLLGDLWGYTYRHNKGKIKELINDYWKANEKYINI